jgi:BASS family bile acid:Na+ symporter
MIRLWLEFGLRHGGALLAASLAVGIAIPPLAAAVRPAITFVVVTLMGLVLLRTDLRAILGLVRSPRLMIWLAVWLMIASPLLTFGLTVLFGIAGSDQAGLVVLATGCAATSAPAFARLVGLDPQLSIVASVGSTLLVPVTAPPLALGLLGIDLALSLPALMTRLSLVVGLPLMASLVVRRLARPEALNRWGRAIDGAAVWCVVLYGLAVMDGVQAAALARPAEFARSLALAFAGGYGLNIATALAFWPFGRSVALTTGLLSGNRNMSLYLAVLPTTTDPGILLFLALCQFPLLLSPFLLRPVYRRLMPPRPAPT